MKKLIKEFKNETVYVLGLDVKDVQEDIYIMPDFFQLAIHFNNDDYETIETEGFVFLLTETEFNSYIEEGLIENQNDVDDWCLKVKNYTGGVYLDIANEGTNESVLVESEDDEDVLTTTTVDLNEICYELFIEFDTDSSNVEFVKICPTR